MFGKSLSRRNLLSNGLCLFIVTVMTGVLTPKGVLAETPAADDGQTRHVFYTIASPPGMRELWAIEVTGRKITTTDIGPIKTGCATLYGVTTTLNASYVPAILYRINPETGAATKIVNLVGSNTVMGFAFARNGKLYATDFTGASGLYVIDPKTGFERAVAAMPFGLSTGLVLADPLP